MPWFYFGFFDGQQCQEDQVGRELPHLGVARAIAEQSAHKMRKQAAMTGETLTGCGFVIENEQHERLLIVPLDDPCPRR